MALDPGTLAAYSSWLAFRQRYLRVPGVQAAVWADGGIALRLALGSSDVASGRAVTDETLFRVASHSKTFTAVAVLQLVEARRLRLDDRVAELLDLPGPLAEVTVRDLLSHAGGVTRDSEDGDFWQLGRPFPDEAELREIAGRPPTAVYKPGEHFKYSNIGFGLLGLVIERITAASYADVMKDAVVDRLGLRSSGPELDPGRLGDFATGYSSLAYAETRVPIEHVDTRALAAATGWFANAADLVTFYAALLPGQDKLLTEASRRQLRHPLWATTAEKTAHYGLGLTLASVGERELFGHGGGYPGHITRTLADPERGVVVSVLTNAIDGPAEPLAAGLSHLLDLGEKATHAPAGPHGERFTGRFAGLWGVQDVVLLSGRLFAFNPTAVKPGEGAEPLEVVDETTLRIVGGPGLGSPGELVRYRYADDGTVLDRRAGSGLLQQPLESFTLPDVVQAPRR